MKAKDRWGTYYLLPGGGQRNGENLSAALKQECLEETGAEIEPVELRYVRDYIGANHEFARWDTGFHQVEAMFVCKFTRRHKGARLNMDDRQTGSEWIPLKELKSLRLYPSVLKDMLSPSGTLKGPLYLGDVN